MKMFVKNLSCRYFTNPSVSHKSYVFWLWNKTKLIEECLKVLKIAQAWLLVHVETIFVPVYSLSWGGGKGTKRRESLLTTPKISLVENLLAGLTHPCAFTLTEGPRPCAVSLATSILIGCTALECVETKVPPLRFPYQTQIQYAWLFPPNILHLAVNFHS